MGFRRFHELSAWQGCQINKMVRSEGVRRDRTRKSRQRPGRWGDKVRDSFRDERGTDRETVRIMRRATIAFRLCSPYFVFMAHDHLTLKGSLDRVPDGHAIGAWKVPGLCGGVVSVGPLAGRPGLPLVRLGRQQPLSTGTQDAVPLARACGQAMSARAGTPMEASHLPVPTWLTAMLRAQGARAGCP